MVTAAAGEACCGRRLSHGGQDALLGRCRVEQADEDVEAVGGWKRATGEVARDGPDGPSGLGGQLAIGQFRVAAEVSLSSAKLPQQLGQLLDRGHRGRVR
jgi:hypothetical protein